MVRCISAKVAVNLAILDVFNARFLCGVDRRFGVFDCEDFRISRFAPPACVHMVGDFFPIVLGVIVETSRGVALHLSFVSAGEPQCFLKVIIQQRGNSITGRGIEFDQRVGESLPTPIPRNLRMISASVSPLT